MRLAYLFLIALSIGSVVCSSESGLKSVGQTGRDIELDWLDFSKEGALIHAEATLANNRTQFMLRCWHPPYQQFGMLIANVHISKMQKPIQYYSLELNYPKTDSIRVCFKVYNDTDYVIELHDVCFNGFYQDGVLIFPLDYIYVPEFRISPVNGKYVNRFGELCVSNYDLWNITIDDHIKIQYYTWKSHEFLANFSFSAIWTLCLAIIILFCGCFTLPVNNPLLDPKHLRLLPCEDRSVRLPVKNYFPTISYLAHSVCCFSITAIVVLILPSIDVTVGIARWVMIGTFALIILSAIAFAPSGWYIGTILLLTWSLPLIDILKGNLDNAIWKATLFALMFALLSPYPRFVLGLGPQHLAMVLSTIVYTASSQRMMSSLSLSLHLNLIIVHESISFNAAGIRMIVAILFFLAGLGLLNINSTITYTTSMIFQIVIVALLFVLQLFNVSPVWICFSIIGAGGATVLIGQMQTAKYQQRADHSSDDHSNHSDSAHAEHDEHHQSLAAEPENVDPEIEETTSTAAMGADLLLFEHDFYSNPANFKIRPLLKSSVNRSVTLSFRMLSLFNKPICGVASRQAATELYVNPLVAPRFAVRAYLHVEDGEKPSSVLRRFFNEHTWANFDDKAFRWGRRFPSLQTAQVLFVLECENRRDFAPLVRSIFPFFAHGSSFVGIIDLAHDIAAIDGLVDAIVAESRKPEYVNIGQRIRAVAAVVKKHLPEVEHCFVPKVNGILSVFLKHFHYMIINQNTGRFLERDATMFEITEMFHSNCYQLVLQKIKTTQEREAEEIASKRSVDS